MMVVKEKTVEEGYKHNAHGSVVLHVGSQPRCFDWTIFFLFAG